MPTRAIANVIHSRFQMSPEPRMAIALSILLWFTTVAFVAPMGYLTGRVVSPGDFLGLFIVAMAGLAFSWALAKALQSLIGRPAIVALPLVLVAIAAAAFFQTLADFGGQVVLSQLFTIYVPPGDWPTFSGTALVYLCLYGCNVALLWITSTDQRARAESLARKEADIAMLRLQLNPTFMIAALDRVVVRVSRGHYDAAAAMTDRLSAFLRDSLQSSSAPLVTLEDELFSAESYLRVEEERGDNRLDFEFICPDELDAALVPNFLLQPLLQHALAHAIPDMPSFVRLRFRPADDQLAVELEHRPSEAPAGDTGSLKDMLDAFARRLGLLYGGRASLSFDHGEGAYRAHIRLPLQYSDETIDGAAS